MQLLQAGFNDETRKIIVAVENDEVCGMATIHEIHKRICA